MYKSLKNLLNYKIVDKHGLAFQEAINELFQLYYRENFIPIRPKHDSGNDGCLKDKTRLFAVYAPETKKSFSEVKTKLISDFDKYQANNSEYKTFTFVYNNPEASITDITAQELKLEDDKNIDFWTRGYLLDFIIKELPLCKIREFATDTLQISKDQFDFSILEWVIDDMQKEFGDENDINYQPPIDITEKIEINFDKSDIDSIKEKMLQFQKDFPKIKEILKDESTAKVLKNKVMQSYTETEPGKIFIERVKIMRKHLSNDSRDDNYLYYVDCIIFYCFEQCLIGRKTKND